MEHRVANALADSGDAVLMVQCDRVLDAYCQVMSPAGLTATSPDHEKRAVCRNCQYAAGIARREAHYATQQLSHYLSAADRSWVDATVSLTTPENWADIEVDGLPVGRYASYTTMLHHKRPTVSETPEAWHEYLADLRGALLVARALPRMVAEEQPTHAVVYNALYPPNRVFAEGLKKSGAILMNLSGGPTVPRRYNTLAIYDGIKASQTMTDSSVFRESREVPASAQEIMAVEDHVAQLMSGSDPWVYSAAASHRPAREIRSDLSVRPDSPVATVIVSSPDETRSNQMVEAEFQRDSLNGYSPVDEFLRASIALARARPEVDFVFRLHPRLAPNKRDRMVSPDLEVIYELLSDLPANAVINHPSEGISLYDLVAISSLAINHTSSAGLEFLIFGVPVVQFDPVRAGIYPAELSIIVARANPQEFALALDHALAAGFDIGHSVAAFRWFASMQVRAVVHLDPLAQPGTPSAVQVAPAISPPAAANPLGRFIPGRLKEFLAARILKRQRSAELASLPPLDEDARRVLLAEIDHVTGVGDVWEPFMVYPDGSSTEVEELEVRAALSRLSSRLALGDLDGVGVVAALAAIRS
jgi:hypothetical protein